VRHSDQISAGADPAAEARRIEAAVIEAFKAVFRKMREGKL
jgi:Xaa-Pro aminopeptidase